LLNKICKYESKLVEYRDCIGRKLAKERSPDENTDSGQRHQYITSSFGEF